MASVLNSAIVLSPNGSDIMTVDVNFGDELEGVIKKQMARPKNEEAIKTLERIQMLMAEKPKKGKKTSRADILKSCPPISVVDAEGESVDSSVTNEEFWNRAAVLTLGKFSMNIRYNVPTVTSITAPSSAMVGMPLLCSGISTMFCSGKDIPLLYEWGHTIDGANVTLSNELVYFPSADLLGKKLYFRARPDVEGAMWTAVDTPKVTKPLAGYEKPMPRWSHTAEMTKGPADVRVVSYNILHDAFCTSVFAKKRIYPFASEEVLDLSNRKTRIVQELKNYNGDVICLQECGKDIFEKYYQQVLKVMGFEAKFVCKTGNVREGLVIAARMSRFHFVSLEYIPLQRHSLDKAHEEIAKEIEEHPHFADAMERITSVGAIAVLEEKESAQKIVVANTHLFYHPNACHIRALQVYILAQRVAEVRKQFGDIPSIVCGDFNFTRPTGGYRLMTTGEVEGHNNCWEKGEKFWWGVDKGLGIEVGEEDDGDSSPPTQKERKEEVPEEQKRKGLEVVPPTETYTPHLCLESGHYVDTHAGDEAMKWTNYSLTFKEIIDHIFVSPTIEVLRTIPLPSEQEVSADVAIPSPTFPSDHVALIADVRLPSPN